MEPPATGHPEGFTGAVGTFRIEAAAEPTSVQVEDPLVLTLTITSSSPATKPPGRLKLHEHKQLDQDFEIDDLSDQDGKPDDRTWTFSYRLRPRHLQATKIPRLKFVYFQPRTGFQTTYTSALTLTLKPREKTSLLADQKETAGELKQKYPLATGDSVLDRNAADELPALPYLLVLLLLPPLACLAWYQVWCRLYPDAARLAHLRRSRAARQALKALRGLKKQQPANEAGTAVAAAVGRYLRQRLELPAAELTPFEVIVSLQQAGVPTALAEQVAYLLHACDAARFGPVSLATGQNLAGQASRLIRQLEAEPCLCHTF
jgi:hypothetical protein